MDLRASQSLSNTYVNHSFCRTLLHGSTRIYNSGFMSQVNPLGEHPVSTAKERGILALMVSRQSANILSTLQSKDSKPLIETEIKTPVS